MIYLDNAATTYPKPASVARAMDEFMQRRAANPGRSGHQLSMAAAREVYLCRADLAAFFNAPGPECVAFTLNATQAVNMAMKGELMSRRGAHVLTSDLEHNAVMRPLQRLLAAGVEYSAAQVDLLDDDATVRAFEEGIRPNTVMIACTHASNLCGRALPIGRIGALCRARGLKFLVDAAQTAGVLPIDMQACGIDYLCLAGHKSLYGPMGTGALIAPEGEKLETLLEGGTGSNSVSLEQPDFMPDRLESGTVNAPGIAGLRAGLAFVKRQGVDALRRREMAAAARLYDQLAEIAGVELYTPRPGEGYVPVVSFNIRGLASSEAATLLDRRGFALRGGMHCAPVAHRKFGTLDTGMVRASFGAFNTKADARRLAEAVASLAGGAGKSAGGVSR